MLDNDKLWLIMLIRETDDMDFLRSLAETETDPEILEEVADNDPYGALMDAFSARTDLADAKYDKLRENLAEHADIETLLKLYKESKSAETKDAIKWKFSLRCPEAAHYLKDMDIVDVANGFSDLLMPGDFYDIWKAAADGKVDMGKLVLALSLYEHEHPSSITDIWILNDNDPEKNPTIDNIIQSEIGIKWQENEREAAEYTNWEQEMREQAEIDHDHTLEAIVYDDYDYDDL